jgi:hypothetical protein
LYVDITLLFLLAFAFGVLLVEMLTGHNPIDARALIDEYSQHIARIGVLETKAKESGWTNTHGRRTSICKVAAFCTDGSATRATPSQVLEKLEFAHKKDARVGLLGFVMSTLNSERVHM